MRSSNWLLLTAVLWFSSALILVSCSSKEVSPDESLNQLSPAEILAEASHRFEELNSFHFTMIHQGGGTPLEIGVEMDTAEGVMAKPDKLKVHLETKGQGLFLDLDVISVGEKTFVTNPFTGLYEDFSEAITPGGFFNPQEGVGNIIRGAQNVQRRGDEQLNQTRVYHLTGIVASEDLRPITGSAVTGEVIKAEIWIGKSDFLVRKLTLQGRITRGERDGVTRTITLSQFDLPVDIELPVAGSTP